MLVGTKQCRVYIHVCDTIVMIIVPGSFRSAVKPIQGDIVTGWTHKCIHTYTHTHTHTHTH